MNSLQSLSQWWDLFSHFASLSLLAIGGAITVAPDLARYLIVERQWLSAQQFNTSIALAQAAPGPNVLFIAVLGWFVGINSAGSAIYGWGLLGALVCLVATLLPSSLLTYRATRWAHHNQHRLSVRAFKQGLAPVVLALLLSTAWIMSAQQGPWESEAGLWGLTVAATLLVWRTRIHLLWYLAAGGLVGALGWV